jgi:hypothetical protein
MPSYTKEDLTVAITSYRRSDYDSIRSCSKAFEIPYNVTTLQTHLNQQKSLSESHENQQLLTSTEESTLVNWVSRLSKNGIPIFLPFTLELAEEIRLNRHNSTPY